MKLVRKSSRFVTATIKSAAAVAAILGSQAPQVAAQGCVASPGSPACMMMPGEHSTTSVQSHHLTGTVAYRWYESARHFGGRTQAGVWLDGDVENTGIEIFTDKIAPT